MRLFILLLVLLLNNIAYSNDAIYVDNYNKAIVLSKELQHKIILIFGADWCIKCSELVDDIAKYNQDFENTIICYINIDKYPDLKKQFKIKKIPVSVILDHKQKIISGYMGYDNYDKYKLWYINKK